MNICDLKQGEKAIVLNTKLDEELKRRLISLGMYTGAKFTVLRVSPLKHTYLIQAGSVRISLGGEVAKEVNVWRI